MRHGGRVQEDRVDRVDDDAVDGLQMKGTGQHMVSGHLGLHPQASYPVGPAGEL